MASSTARTKLIRKSKKKTKGKRRKRILRSKGSTPKFSVQP